MVPIARQSGPARVVVSGLQGEDALYVVELTAAPSAAWRTAFNRVPTPLLRTRSTAALRRLYLHGSAVYFRTARRRLDGSLRRIDRWIAYANSIVEE